LYKVEDFPSKHYEGEKLELLNYPPENSFIPKELISKKAERDAKDIPKVIMDSPNSKVWFK